MINFHNDLILPIQYALNSALGGQTQGVFNYAINDVPKNYRYAFIFNTDTGDYMHAEKQYQSGTLHDNNLIYINGNASVNPVSREGIDAKLYDSAQAPDITSYNALIDATITFTVPLYQVHSKRAFISEIRRLVDGVLMSSQTRLETIDGKTYQIGTEYELLATGNRQNRSSIGDSVDFVLRLTFTVVSMGISSDKIELYIDGERILFTHFGMARKVVKEMGELSSSVTQNTPIPSQKSFISGTYLSINFDLPARFSEGVGTPAKSFNEKLAEFILTNESAYLNVTVKYPKTVTQTTTESGITNTINYLTRTFEYMKFDTVGVNGETGLIASQSITLTEV